MAGYLVLARKYRSTTFDEVVGQEPIAQTLVNAINTGRIAHAYLFTGTRGVGKTTMARILAKALNCLSSDRPTATPCNKCDACVAIGRGDDVDVVEIDGASNRGIDEIRELRANAIFRPSRSRYKIYYIDEVHMLTKEAFNALLKTLEEPPEHVKFIFATTETEKVPATILSRCQRYDFRNIPTRKIADHLKALCKAESVPAEDDALFRIARAAAGSMRDALSLLDQLIAAGAGNVTDADVVRVLGTPADERTLAIAQAIAEGNSAAALTHLNGILESGVTLASATAALGDIFRNIMLALTCGLDSELIELPELQRQSISELAKKFSLPAVVQAVGIIQSVAYKVRQSSVARALVEAAIVRLAEADKFVDPTSLLERIEALGGAGAGRALPPRGGTASAGTVPGAARPPMRPGPLPGQANDIKKNSLGIAEPQAQPSQPGKAVPHAAPQPGNAGPSDQTNFAPPARPQNHGPSFSLSGDAPKTPAAEPAAAAPPNAAPPPNHNFGNLSVAEKEEVIKDPAVQAVLGLFGGEVADVKRIAPVVDEETTA